MYDYALLLSAGAALIWGVTLCLPGLAWTTREVLEADQNEQILDLSDISVIIPARNEAEVIEKTLLALVRQGSGLNIILVDDESTDTTVDKARALQIDNLQIIRGKPLPAGWTGKLWAQQQGLQAVQTANTLLLDADIELLPGIVKSLKLKQQTEDLHLVSLMARLRFVSFWEKLLMPAFIHFFKMLYPFSLANRPASKVAAAAGGCILVKTECLHKINAMTSIKDALIDDCTLAKKIKSAGYKTWIGLTHGVISQRSYITLHEIWDMVARTAYSQLHYSLSLLGVCTILMLIMYIFPVFGVFYFTGITQGLCFVSVLIMLGIYIPTLKFYSLPRGWAFTMPFIAGLYLLMTWTSAVRYWQGERSRWKDRIYQSG